SARATGPAGGRTECAAPHRAIWCSRLPAPATSLSGHQPGEVVERSFPALAVRLPRLLAGHSAVGHHHGGPAVRTLGDAHFHAWNTTLAEAAYLRSIRIAVGSPVTTAPSVN